MLKKVMLVSAIAAILLVGLRQSLKRQRQRLR